VRKILGVVSAVALLAAAAAGTRLVEASRDRTVQKDVARAAEAAGARATDALAAHVAELKLKVQNATANPRLAAALEGNVDAGTLRDLFRSEVWWAPYRDEFKVYAIAFESEKLDVVEGMAGADLAADLLVRATRERREAVSDIIMGKGWPYAAAAAIAPVPGRAAAPVLVLAKPIDDAAVRKLSERAQGAVLLSDGKTAVIETGNEAERTRLRTAVGSETKGPVFVPPAGGEAWAGAVSRLAPGLWMWTFATPAAARDAETSAAATKAALWSIAGVAAIALLIFGFRRGSAAAPTPVFTTAELAPQPGAGAMDRETAAAESAALGNAATGYHPGQSGLTGAPEAGRSVTFGRYTLLDRLGEGGMAEVYTAVTFGAEGFRRAFVVKRLRAELARDPAVVAQFIDEANLGSTLVHSNIIPVFDFGKVADEYYLAQEYIVGRDLGRVTARMFEREHRPLPVPVVLHIAHEVSKALEYAHGKLGDNGRPLGIVHRDVSPSNILLSARGEVKLFDFGIVKAEGRVTQTQQGVVKGNVNFMSPEQARGGETDARADLFSLGLVMFYCLTGDVLYHGNTTYELLVKAATGPGPEEVARIAALPSPCPEILRRALAVEPGERYQSAAEMGAALAPFVTGAATEVVRLVGQLFAADFQQEEARFAAAVPAGDRGARTAPPPTATGLISRRS